MLSTRHPLFSKQSGLGMVEVLVAMLISLVLLVSVINVFLTNKESARLQKNLAAIQETARYAMHVLSHEVRMAGYSGCSPNVVNHLDPTGTGYSDALYNLQAAVGGWEYTNQTTVPGTTYSITTLYPSAGAANHWEDSNSNNLPSDLYQDTLLNARVVPGTDIIVVKRLATPLSVSPDNNPNINNETLKLKTNPSGIPQGTILMVTEDCQSADLFQKNNADTANDITKGGSVNPGNRNAATISGFSGGQKWSKLYTSAATLLSFRSNVYYIGTGASGLPALWQASYSNGPTGTHVELVDGVENMQVLYGEDTDSPEDGVANRYRPINTVTDNLKIVSVRISLLIRSPEQIQSLATDLKTYLLTGLSNATATIIDPIDSKHLRVVATTTVKLRNKGENL